MTKTEIARKYRQEYGIEMPNSIGVYFEMEPYGNFQDKGVSGVKQKFDTPYSYKTKIVLVADVGTIVACNPVSV